MRKRRLVMLLVLVASMVGALAVNRGAAGVPEDLQALITVVQDGFTAVQNALSDIQDSLNSLSAEGQSNVRFTPSAFVNNLDGVTCRVVKSRPLHG